MSKFLPLVLLLILSLLCGVAAPATASEEGRRNTAVAIVAGVILFGLLSNDNDRPECYRPQPDPWRYDSWGRAYPCPPPSPPQQIYRQGYNSGYHNGFQNGYNWGYRDGRQDQRRDDRWNDRDNHGHFMAPPYGGPGDHRYQRR